jgi:hypothetical protein
MSLYSLQHVLAHHIPQYYTAILTRRCDEWLSVESREAASDGELLVAMALVGLLDGARDVVPETNAIVEVESEYVAAVGGEADVRYSGVVFVNEGS